VYFFSPCADGVRRSDLIYLLFVASSSLIGRAQEGDTYYKETTRLNCWLLCHIFSLCVTREGFFPAQSHLLTYWRQESACQNSGCWARQRIGLCWVIFGGVLLGWQSMMPSFSLKYHCVSSLRVNARFFVLWLPRMLLGVQAAGQKKELVRDESFLEGSVDGHHVGRAWCPASHKKS